MTSKTDAEAMSSVLETIAEVLLQSSEFIDNAEEEDGTNSFTIETYNDLKKARSKSDESTQFAKLEKVFPSTNSVLKHYLPVLFEAVDTISIKNIIYNNPELVNKLLNDVLFRELTTLDVKLAGLYKKITSEDKESNYIPLQITYNADNKSFEVNYPDFLDDAFESIKRKIEKHGDYRTIVSIKKEDAFESIKRKIEKHDKFDTIVSITKEDALGKSGAEGYEEGYEEGYNTDVVAATAAAVTASVAAVVEQAPLTTYGDLLKYERMVEPPNERDIARRDMVGKGGVVELGGVDATSSLARVGTQRAGTPRDATDSNSWLRFRFGLPQAMLTGWAGTDGRKRSMMDVAPQRVAETGTPMKPEEMAVAMGEEMAEERAATDATSPTQPAQQGQSALWLDPVQLPPPRRRVEVPATGSIVTSVQARTSNAAASGLAPVPSPADELTSTTPEDKNSLMTVLGKGGQTARNLIADLGNLGNYFGQQTDDTKISEESAQSAQPAKPALSAQPAKPALSAQQLDAKAKDDEYRQSAEDALHATTKPEWFNNIFNFDETNDWTIDSANFSMDGDYLLCNTATRDNCKRQYVGDFACLSLASLKDMLSRTSAISGKGLSFKHIIDNVADLHYRPENAGAVFQAASQFNCLEMVNPYYTPSHGVAVYANDGTQGPACAMACPAALVYRNYLVKHKDNNVQANNTKDDKANTGQNPTQIDTLRNLGSVVGNYSREEPRGVYWTMENGYAFIKNKDKLEDLNRKLSNPTLANSAMNELRFGVHWETSVNPLEVGNPHNVCQVYASALPIAYTIPRFTIADTQHPLEDDWMPFASLILNASYEATLAVAAKKLKDKHNPNERISCFLTLLGGGVFGNKPAWIATAIKQAIDKYLDWPIDVILVHLNKQRQGDWLTRIEAIEAQDVVRVNKVPTPILGLEELKLEESKLKSDSPPLFKAPESCPIKNPSIYCWANAAIQLLWHVDGVRDFLINSDGIDTSKLSIHEELDLIYPVEDRRKQNALKEVNELLGTNRIDENRKLLNRNTFRALRELFITINSSNKSSALALDEIMFSQINKDSSPTQDVSIRGQLDEWFSVINPPEIDPITGEQLTRQQDSSEFINILDIIKDFMNIESLNMFKSYNLKHTETKICSNEKTAETIPEPIFVIDHSIELPIDDDLVRDIGDITYDSISNLLAIHQSRREIGDSKTLAKSKKDSCYPKGHIQYEERNYDSFYEGTSLIIYLKRTNYDLKQKRSVKDTRAVIPNKILQFSKKQYILQGCILHISNEAHYGHYIYIIYDRNGEPTEIIDDGHKFDKNSNPKPDPDDPDSTDVNYNGTRFVENIKQINTNGFMFLYKDLNKMQQIATAAAQLAKPFIDHAKMRVDQLRYQLYTTNANVVIAGLNGKHNLVTGVAKLQWIKYYVDTHPINVIISAQRLFVEKLDELFKELRGHFQTKVSYSENVTTATATLNKIVVWGANFSNCYGLNDTKIEGFGQAEANAKHGPGVFGIITTPINGVPPVDIKAMKGFASDPKDIRTSDVHNKELEESLTLRTDRSTSRRPSIVSRALTGLSPMLGRETARRLLTTRVTTARGETVRGDKEFQELLLKAPGPEHLNVADFGIRLEQELAAGAAKDEYAQRRDILRDTLDLFAKNRKQYYFQAINNVKRWSTGKKAKPTSCILTVTNKDWGTRAQEVTETYGTIFACLNMANADNPGGAYTAGVAAQEENMFRRTDCHFSLIPDITIERISRAYTSEMTQLINGKRIEDHKYIVYLDKDPRICIKGEEVYTRKSGIITISGYDMLKDNKKFPFYEMRSAAQYIQKTMLFNEDEMTMRIHAQINTLIKKEIKHVVLGAFGCGAFRNPPERIACIYREKLKAELKKNNDCFKVIEFPIFYAGNGANNFDIFKRAFQDTYGEDEDGIGEMSWIYNTTDFKVKHTVTIDKTITYTTPENYGGDITTVMTATDFLLTDKDFNNPNKDELKSAKERKRIYIMQKTLESFKTYNLAVALFENARKNFAIWQTEAKTKQPTESTAKVIVEPMDWGDATLKYTQAYGKIFACLNMANEAVPGGGYIKGMGAQEENMFRRTNCHFTIESNTLDTNNLATAEEWNKKLYKQDKKDLLKGEYGYVYFDWEYPRVCIRGPELPNNADLGYAHLSPEEIFPFYELRCAALDRRIGKNPPQAGMTDGDKATMQKRINAQLETLIVHGVKHVILGAFGCGIFQNDPEIIAKMYREAISNRSTHFEVIVFAILRDHSNQDARSNNKNYETFSTIFTAKPINIGAASVPSAPSAVRFDMDAKYKRDIDLDLAIAASLANGTSISTEIDYSNPEKYGQNIVKSWTTNSFTFSVDYRPKSEEIRMKILIDTIINFTRNHLTYHKSAVDNLKRWEAEAEAKADAEAKALKKTLVDVVHDDWGDAALKYTKIYGTKFACLNMASEIYPGGSYNLGGSGQEENMFRRTNCHFTVNRQEQLEEISKTTLTKIEEAVAYGEAYWKYNLTQTNHIKGDAVDVYLDKQNFRICIKGAETVSPDLGYSYLDTGDIFFFYEVRCAPLDRRTPLLPNRNMDTDTKTIKKRIEALFKTLKEGKIKHVILGDFGCGKLKNNPFTIAYIYREVISTYANDFEKIVITIPNAKYNTTIFEAFKKVFTTYSIADVVEDKAEEIAEEFLMLARDRINELRNILDARHTAKVKIAANTITDTTHNLARGSAQKLWTTKYGAIGEDARQIFINKLDELFGALKRDFPKRVSYGPLKREEASLDHYLIWGAYTDTYESTPTRVRASERFIGGSQAETLSPHTIGLFGIIAAPGDPPST